MGVTVQVRNLDPEVQETLKAEAASKGLSLSEYLRRTLNDMAERILIHKRWDEAVARHEAWLAKPRRSRKPIHIDRETLLEIIRESRDER